MEALGLALGIVTIILGINEATFDVLDRMGSNYWLAYSSVISGIVLISLILDRFHYRTSVASTVQKNIREAC
jgi:F420-0:gamma-glutamyl ligase-like protein